ncbi:MAG TPA: LarC family nickel insertion protein [Burkholderiales bacterium]|nr:LarC family nickel insertion protein [Burkholderiales bacterium]
MHLHLDAIGGMAGDMFIAAVLDAFPDLRDGMLEAIAAAGLPPQIHVGLAEHRDHALTGLRFKVVEPREPGALAGAAHHPHTPFADIRAQLQASPLAAPVRQRAIAIFTELARVEAQVHGKTVDTVSFHEVGEWDSIVDIVGAAFLIEALSPATWSVGALPLGRGRAKTAHGALPVPTPATVLLLKGFEFIDDGLEGERVTPTGASILKHLGCSQAADRGARRLLRSGTGFGTKTFPGISNVVRLLAFEAAQAAAQPQGDEVVQVLFEVDDQSPEDLSIALDKLRAHPAVLDVLQSPAFGKKGRITMRIQVLAEVDGIEGVFDACFRETTTIGLRYQRMQRRKLARTGATVEAGGRQVRVKVSQRPGRATAKVEADDLLNVMGGRAEREALRAEAEGVVLRKDRP